MHPAQQSTKLSAAQAFESILKRLGYSIMLGGGGGATALGGPRDIKDVDFKMGSHLKEAWENNELRTKIIKEILDGMKGYGYLIEKENSASATQVKYVLRITVIDRLTGEARAEKESRPKWEKSKEAVEISLTTSGVYDESTVWESHMGPALFLHPLSPGQMILDKLFVIAQREKKETAKIVTDFEDLASLVEQYDVSLEHDLKEIRVQGYAKSAKRSNSDPSLSAEVRERIALVGDDLLKAPKWSKLQDPALRAVEVKFMTARVERLLKLVDEVIGKLQ